MASYFYWRALDRIYNGNGIYAFDILIKYKKVLLTKTAQLTCDLSPEHLQMQGQSVAISNESLQCFCLFRERNSAKYAK